MPKNPQRIKEIDEIGLHVEKILSEMSGKASRD